MYCVLDIHMIKDQLKGRTGAKLDGYSKRMARKRN